MRVESPWHRTIIQQLKEQRHRLGITQPELAEQTKASISTISAMERGHQNMSLETICRIADALDLGVIVVPKHVAEEWLARLQPEGNEP